jgi:hypothetical protein
MRTSTIARIFISSSSVKGARPAGWSPIPPPGSVARVASHPARSVILTVSLEGNFMAYTYHELKEKTIQELRELAKAAENQEAVQGYSQMNKEHLLPALCKALGVPIHEHHEVVGIDKPAIKAQMKELKKKRGAAIDAHDSDALKVVRRQIHRLNRQIRAHVAP